MKKFTDLILSVFGIGMTVCLFAGGFAIFGFIVALILGGEIATEICVFIHKVYFMWVIRFTAIFSALGLLGMYLKKTKALTITSNEEKK